MKIALTISIAFACVSCVQYGYDPQGKPKGTFFAAKANGVRHDSEGFYADGIDSREGFKDAMDFGGTAVGVVVGADVMKSLSADSIAVDNSKVKAGSEVAKSKEVTKRVGIKEAAGVEKAKIHAIPTP